MGRLDANNRPKREDMRKQKPKERRSWTTLERVLAGSTTLMVLIIGALILMLTTGGKSSQKQVVAAQPTAAVQPTIGALPTAAATAVPPEPIIHYFPDIPPLVLNLQPQTPQKPINLSETVKPDPQYAGDLAWNKPTFANAFYVQGYPSLSTIGSSGWRSADSDGSWLYVDLKTPTSFRQILVSTFVDTNFTNSPRNYYIVSDDLVTWRVIIDEINTANSSMRFKVRVLTLPSDVTARYVGLYAQDWRGGWGGVQSFSVIPAGYDYKQETLPQP